MNEKEMIKIPDKATHRETIIREIASDMYYGCTKRDLYPKDAKAIAEALYLLNYRKIPEGSVVLSEGEYSDIIEDEVKTLKRDIAEYWACSDIDVVAQEFHKDGYRKLDDHAIITLRKAKGLEEKIRKETTKEILTELFKQYSVFNDNDVIIAWQVKEALKDTAKKHGVEVQE